MDGLKELFHKDIVKRMLAVLILAAAVYSMKSLMDLFLLTFLFTYLIYSFEVFLLKKIRQKFRFNELALVLILYMAIFVVLGYFVYKYIPIIIGQALAIIDQISDVNKNHGIYDIEKHLEPLIGQFDLNAYLKNEIDSIFEVAANIGKWGLNIFIALMLSLFFILGKRKIRAFLDAFYNSRISGFYQSIVYFGKSFFNSFGKVIQAQILIALTNSVLSIMVLYFLGFPQLLALGFMIFILSLVPIAGTIISLIPLAVIAFNIGGIVKVIYVIGLILILHGLESYVLNPQFMSSKTEIPVFFVFIILIISEHFFGLWGLLVGLPIFMFILDLIGVNYSSNRKKNE